MNDERLNNTTMMTQWRNSLTWHDTVSYAASVYGFIISGKGEMTGAEFCEHIKNMYDCGEPRMKTILSECERHIALIRVRPDGAINYSLTY